jgi:hypothetical protein
MFVAAQKTSNICKKDLVSKGRKAKGEKIKRLNSKGRKIKRSNAQNV